MSWLKASVAIATAQAVRMIGGLILIKITAMYLGPEGYGRLGHFMSLAAILAVLAGGAVLNGMVKYVAEYKNSPEKLQLFISNALAYSFLFSLFLFIVIFFSANLISSILFNSDEYSKLIIFLGVVQFFYGMVTYCNGIINGLRKTIVFVKILIFGTLIGVPASCYFIAFYGFEGAVIGIALINACFLFPGLYELYRLDFFKKIKFSLNIQDTAKLSKFSIMQIFSLATLPLAEIYIRGLIVNDFGWYQAGLWQSLMRLSSVYVAFFTTFLVSYYMPKLSVMIDKEEIFKYVSKYMLSIGGIFILIAIGVYILRDFVFTLLFSNKFIIPDEYVKFQLLGDLFKIMSYVICYLIVAKAKAKLYIISEIVQAILYFSLVMWFMRTTDVSMVFTAYALSNFIYFSICLFGLFWFKNLSSR